MATTFAERLRPDAGSDYRSPSRARSVGLAFAVVGVLLAAVTLINNIVAGNLVGQGEPVGALHAWSFGLTTTAFGTVKFAIAIILIGIIGRLWIRVDSVKNSLPALRGNYTDPGAHGPFESEYGPGIATAKPPARLRIHTMAEQMWAPMLAMGAMLVLGGLVLSFIQAGTVATDPALARSQFAWVQGLQFLGEAFLLSGISFLLGSILSAIRKGGGEVQLSLGLTVKTLDMPKTAKAFIALMMAGLMLGIVQFVAYVIVAGSTDPGVYAANFAWLGPLREVSLGLLLSGIVLALASIANALGFQFSRIAEIVKN